MSRSRCGVTGRRSIAPGNADRVVDRGRDGGADRVRSALAGSLEAERIERARRILGDQHVDRRHLACGGHQVVREGDRQRLAALVVEEFLEQSAAEPLRKAAGDLALDQHRIDRAADVVGDEIALDRHAAGVAVHLGDGDMHAVGIVHVIGEEPALGGKTRITGAAQFRGRLQRLGDVGET